MATTVPAGSDVCATGLPPGPRAPSWWQLWRFSGDLLNLLDEGRRRHGDAFTLDIAGHGRFVMLSGPEAIREVFRADPTALHSGEANALLVATVGRSSARVLDEAPHARQRRALVPPLKGDRMRAFFEAMRLETLEALRGWPEGAPFAARPGLRRITLRVIVRAALGLAPGPELDRFVRLVEDVLANGRRRSGLVMRAVVPIERLSGSRRVPLFRRLRTRDDALHALIAGHETTAPATSWALVDLAEHPEAADRIADELRRTCGAGCPPDAALRESLRRSVVVPFVVRKVVRTFAVGGREDPAGVVLCPCAHLVHRREDLYPEPGRFRPERFLARKYGPHEWFPFGGVNRVCFGMPFALYGMKVLLATLLSRARPGRPAGARSRARRYGLVPGPDDGARVRVVGRVATP